ncbi:zinc finger [Plasmopara halstedii]|uniref:Zinc finger n=1 Tax=Plasmopara halstedii TaxID=4781 RepID=A0A0P1A8C7_PLAHL|nr:zinc finger [Plasmopara halstedii]CEG36952.1 zinc finger [Plasmopara halstedii]|eukprot:XP_024573321.1 zinc finger [Plasmopara halstedii]
MWCRLLVRCRPAAHSSRVLLQSLSSQTPCLACTANSSSYVLRSASISSTHHCFSTQRDDSPVTEATTISSVPGVESPGDKFVMVYTCSVCETRSAKTISKHAYYKGVVLVRCPGCENLHLIADRLGWFEDDATDVESLLKQKGKRVRFITEKDVLELTENDILGTKNEN